MKESTTFLLCDDDEGHVQLITRNFKRNGVENKILHFKNGQEIIDFFNHIHSNYEIDETYPYIVLLDIRMPKVDGISVLNFIKSNSELKKIPVIMLTTTDDPKEISNCYLKGCNNYLTKPVEYDAFIEVIKRLASFVQVMKTA
jgi:CheY-like chemotaxis protein